MNTNGKSFNPLAWPFLLATAAYGVGLSIIFPLTNLAGNSSLYHAMTSLGSILPFIWGGLAILAIIGVLSYLLCKNAGYGKLAALLGASIWFFAGGCYIATGDWLVLLSVAIPNLIYWIWQYIDLSKLP